MKQGKATFDVDTPRKREPIVHVYNPGGVAQQGIMVIQDPTPMGGGKGVHVSITGVRDCPRRRDAGEAQVIDLIFVNPLEPPASGGPAPGYKWNDVETLLNVVVMANVLGPNANNISAAARSILYDLNVALAPPPPPQPNPLEGKVI